MKMVPERMAPWVMHNAPVDAVHPTDCKSVDVWQDGWSEVKRINPNSIPADLDIHKLYWRPASSK
jgi:hypothetical protein